MLTEDDLAYMRGVQGEHRPVPATLTARTEAPDGMGGTTWADGDSQAITVRLKGNEDIPDELAAKYGPNVVRLTMDLVDVTTGDRVTVDATEAYQVVSDGDPSRWATAQQVWAVRTVWP